MFKQYSLYFISLYVHIETESFAAHQVLFVCAYLELELIAPVFLIQLCHEIPCLCVTVWICVDLVGCSRQSLVGCCYSMYIKCPAMLWLLSFGKAVCWPSNVDNGSICLSVQMKTWPRKLNINVKIGVSIVDFYFTSKFSVWSLCYYLTIGFNAMSTYQDPKTCWKVREISFCFQLLCGVKEN